LARFANNTLADPSSASWRNAARVPSGEIERSIALIEVRSLSRPWIEDAYIPSEEAWIAQSAIGDHVHCPRSWAKRLPSRSPSDVSSAPPRNPSTSPVGPHAIGGSTRTVVVSPPAAGAIDTRRPSNAATRPVPDGGVTASRQCSG
jgi:hypothetical protein